jgi:alpha-amylase
MTQTNGTILQFFHWYTPADGSHWQSVAARASELAARGITAAWLPPAYKGAAGSNDVGYGVYDLYDLGEFDQKGSVRTKYGTKDQYLAAIKALQSAGIHVYADIVLNHCDGADELEHVRAIPHHGHSRLVPIGDAVEVDIWTKFTFPGRGGHYSDFTWNHTHFDAVSYAANRNDAVGTVYLIEGHKFDDYVDQEKGNFDYLMGCDYDLENLEVRRELLRWSKWYLDLTNVDGLRLDAIKHMSAWAFAPFLEKLRHHGERELFAVGEYWTQDLATLKWHLDATGGNLSLFDVPLHMNFHRASRNRGQFDMRTLLDGTLMKEYPARAVTFVDNHDSQPLQALESPVDPWFKPLAYAIILLRAQGYPCVFIADYDGAKYADKGISIELPSHRFLLDLFLAARRDLAYGPQHDYFDHGDCIGWTRTGDADHPKAIAVILSEGQPGQKLMNVERTGRRFMDITGHIPEEVMTDEHGHGMFRCNAGSVSVWVEQPMG